MSRSAVPFPQPLGADAPPTCEVPHFAPVRVRGGRHQLHRLVRDRRRAVAAGLAVTAAALVAAGPHPGTGAQDGGRARGHPVSDRARERAAGPVAAPVRIADAATVRLLAPGDHVDVVASGEGADGGASVIARRARVVEVPEPAAGVAGDGAPEAGVPDAGALVVLSVPAATAHRLVGAGVRARLAVTLC
ncbi:RcpC/CpaB family pilus assembly protein [Streptomyces sp. NPDC059701]|uniref:RcpC/CpaB family pilus assembly protein n=1 Tax=Streptomyces sp. NPDC059701 TaxID=3346914 RepID=UPI0036930FE7